MAFADLERFVYANWRTTDISSHFAAVTEYLKTATGVNYGRGLSLAAALAYAEDFRNVVKALIWTDEALALLGGDALQSGICLMDGLQYARRVGDIGKAERYAKCLSVLLRVQQGPEFQAWTGRMYLALARHYENSLIREAERYYQMAVAWHRHNIGPHDDIDRRCQLAMSYAGLCRVALAKGNVEAAAKHLSACLNAWPPERWNGPVRYVEGLVAEAQGQFDKVRSICDELSARDELKFNHGLRLDLAELEARWYAQAGDARSAYVALEPIMRDLAGVGATTQLLRIQRLIKQAAVTPA